ncbi:hypothetical protein AVV32_gp04 [Pseudomonas phage PhiCHU]|uniref:Uncharacterized protein n=1 Tax=Pseudomonas phage PhiCHU TaxID=1589273 RepID=A0A0B4ZZ23_9CAUD|nr:hypothetical protein AVV32_gp04 [Pseudomonas phage PhiCHU]AJD82697.1 hypothetical protein PhiCHU_04 [Pseudomonas phage PhiCHU]
MRVVGSAWFFPKAIKRTPHQQRILKYLSMVNRGQVARAKRYADRHYL